MSNVTDAKSWQGISMSNAPPHLRTDQPQVVLPDSESHAREHNLLADVAPREIAGLAMILRHLADGGVMPVHWGIPQSTSENVARGDQLVRLDPQHDVDRGDAASVGASAGESPREIESEVIVDRWRNLDAADGAQRIESMLRSSPALIVVAWDDEPLNPSDLPQPDETGSALARLSERTGLDYSGPVPANEPLRLFEMLSKIKDRGRPALVHVRAETSRGPSEARASTVAPERLGTHAFRQIASLELADQAAHDSRVVVAAVSMDAEFLEPWREIPHRALEAGTAVAYALRWCAALASEGGRPFVFLPLDELHGNFGQIRREICAKQAPVTLLVDPGMAPDDDEIVSAASLAGIRQLPHVTLVSPKNGDELRQMIRFSMSHDGPTVIWLPNVEEPQTHLLEGPGVELGRAEQLSTGEHVALVAWGPMVAAAEMAAHVLLQYGIETSVINARFAQPLDLDTIARVTRAALCTVLVDDVDVPGGFSSWVVDQLSRLGVAQPVAIVAPHPRSLRQFPYQVHQQCALRIVEHCRWLVDPVNRASDAAVVPNLPARTGDLSTSRVWLSTPSIKVRDDYDEHRQVLAQQFSPFIEEWVRRYSKVGARDIYLWRWCLHGLDLTTLPCVAPELRAHVCDTKLLSIILCVLLDDVADQHGDGGLLHSLLEFASCGVSPTWDSLRDVERQHGTVARAALDAYWQRAATYPCFATFEPVLRYDLLQFFNTMRYSHLVNGRLYLLNMAEHDLYTPHNMMMVSFATLDLMCSPGFPRAEVGALREAMWHAQCMGRIGNLLSTWKRELADRDFTSGVFARAIYAGDLTLDELEHGSAAALEAAIAKGDHEAYFLRRWFEHRERYRDVAKRVRSLDLEPILVGHDRFLTMHLESRGLI